ncbi:hypothetical protein [Streptomyces sp. NPDC020489]|uniref:hypothetical protein n=1 Tax=Streptomyces sp. NPDC020489 TaxID=3365077 RepID=UPI0037960AAB
MPAPLLTSAVLRSASPRWEPVRRTPRAARSRWWPARWPTQTLAVAGTGRRAEAYGPASAAGTAILAVAPPAQGTAILAAAPARAVAPTARPTSYTRKGPGTRPARVPGRGR